MTKLEVFNTSIPEHIFSSHNFMKKYKLSDEHVKNLENATGILERRYAGSSETVESMCLQVVSQILEKSGLTPDQIGGLIIGTLTPTYFTPSTAVVVANKLGIKNCFAFDVSAACSGWVYGVHTARAYIESGIADNIIVIGAEKLSATLNEDDYRTAFLFGDGASGCLVSRETSDKQEECEVEKGIIASKIIIENDANLDVYIKTPFANQDWTFPQWNLLGKEVYTKGVELVSREILKYFEDNNLSWDDFTGFIPHQANARMISEICENVKLPAEKLHTNIKFRGNTGACSIPLCICETVTQSGRYLLYSIGAGYTAGYIDTYLRVSQKEK